MRNAEPMDSQRSTTTLMGVLERLKEKKSMDIESTYRFGNKDLIVYALGSKLNFKNKTKGKKK